VSEETSVDRSIEHPGRRRLLRVLAAAGIALGVYALCGFLLVPPLARWAIETKGRAALHREVTLREARFNPFTLELNLAGLRIRDRDRRPLLDLERLHLQLAPSGVLRRAWRLHDLRIEGPVAELRILPDGRLSIADLFTNDDKSTALPRLIIDRFAIHNGKLEIIDESVTPPVTASFAPANAEVRELVTLPEERGEHTLAIAFDSGGSKSSIRMTGTQIISPLGLSGRIEARNIALPPLAARLTSGGSILLRSGLADLGIDYDVRRGKGGGLQLQASRGELTATGVTLAPAGQGGGQGAAQLAIPRLEVRDARIAFPARRVEIGSVRMIGPRGSIGWDAQGRFAWASQGGAPQSAQPAAAAPSAPPIGRPAGEQWSVTLAKATIEHGALHIDDLQQATPVRLDLNELTIEASGISSNSSAPLAVSAAANANGGRVSLHGTLIPSPFSLDCQSSLAAIDLSPLRPYVDTVPGLTLAAGNLGFDGRMLFSSQQPYLIEGDGAINGIEFLDAGGHRLLASKAATLHKLRLDGSSSQVRIRSIDVDGMYANVEIDKQKNLNLSAIGGPATNEPKKGSVDIGVINIGNGTIDYRDDSLVLPFATAISHANGKISDFSTTGAAASTIRLEGQVADHGSMNAEGTMHTAEPFAHTDLSMRFKSIPMPALTPYFAEFAGYEIERGALDLDLHYQIVARKLIGDHRVMATDLTLGKKVGGTKAGFAVRLAVALLKDRNGRIALQVPIQGDIDSPEFNYRAVLWEAVRTILSNVARSPFRAFGRSMGVDAENLELVSFDPGMATVMPAETEKLGKIAAELAARPELTLEIEGRFDPELDAEELKKARVESLIATRRDAPRTGATEAPSLETILETVYSETFSPARLEEERAKFTTAPAPPPPEPSKNERGSKLAPKPAAVVAAATHFDGNGFYDEIRTQIAGAQTISTDELRALGRARAAAIAAALTSGGTLQATRLKALDPVEAKRKPGSQEVRSEMKLSTGQSGSDD
jgi:uncharacterized protein involved in outer membrane biogenesis